MMKTRLAIITLLLTAASPVSALTSLAEIQAANANGGRRRDATATPTPVVRAAPTGQACGDDLQTRLPLAMVRMLLQNPSEDLQVELDHERNSVVLARQQGFAQNCVTMLDFNMEPPTQSSRQFAVSIEVTRPDVSRCRAVAGAPAKRADQTDAVYLASLQSRHLECSFEVTRMQDGRTVREQAFYKPNLEGFDQCIQRNIARAEGGIYAPLNKQIQFVSEHFESAAPVVFRSGVTSIPHTYRRLGSPDSCSYYEALSRTGETLETPAAESRRLCEEARAGWQTACEAGNLEAMRSLTERAHCFEADIVAVLEEMEDEQKAEDADDAVRSIRRLLAGRNPSFEGTADALEDFFTTQIRPRAAAIAALDERMQWCADPANFDEEDGWDEPDRCFGIYREGQPPADMLRERERLQTELSRLSAQPYPSDAEVAKLMDAPHGQFDAARILAENLATIRAYSCLGRRTSACARMGVTDRDSAQDSVEAQVQEFERRRPLAEQAYAVSTGQLDRRQIVTTITEAIAEYDRMEQQSRPAVAQAILRACGPADQECIQRAVNTFQQRFAADRQTLVDQLNAVNGAPALNPVPENPTQVEASDGIIYAPRNVEELMADLIQPSEQRRNQQPQVAPQLLLNGVAMAGNLWNQHQAMNNQFNYQPYSQFQGNPGAGAFGQSWIGMGGWSGGQQNPFYGQFSQGNFFTPAPTGGYSFNFTPMANQFAASTGVGVCAADLNCRQAAMYGNSSFGGNLFMNNSLMHPNSGWNFVNTGGMGGLQNSTPMYGGGGGFGGNFGANFGLGF